MGLQVTSRRDRKDCFGPDQFPSGGREVGLVVQITSSSWGGDGGVGGEGHVTD